MTGEPLAAYPDSSAYGRGDWHALAGFWHPVATSAEVTDQPVSAQLLDTPVVLYRTRGGISVALDRCPHRGARLSRGWLREDRLICPYHGLHFDGAGACTFSLDPTALVTVELLIAFAALGVVALIPVLLKRFRKGAPAG